MSIWLRAHWPTDASHFQDSDEHDNAIANLEQLTDPILDAIERSINHAAPDGDAIFPELRRRLDHIPRCPINPGDAFQIALQCIQDIGDYDFDNDTFTIRPEGWTGYEAHVEGVQTHSILHAARPYECGPDCTATIVYALET